MITDSFHHEVRGDIFFQNVGSYKSHMPSRPEGNMPQYSTL
jgi:hypothetical protein